MKFITVQDLKNAIKLYKDANAIVYVRPFNSYLWANNIHCGLCQLLCDSHLEMKQLSNHIKKICDKLSIPYTLTGYNSNTFYVGGGPLEDSPYKERDINYRIRILEYMLKEQTQKSYLNIVTK